MDVLRNLFGNLTSGIIRLAVAVGILAAVYFFAIRPVLDTTNKAIDSANENFRQGFSGQGEIQRQIQHNIRQTNRRVQRQITISFRQTRKGGGPDPQQLLRCVQRANGNVTRIQRCARKY
jgi:uncharacterized protein with von Willebrand factor type A (vWA) domain